MLPDALWLHKNKTLTNQPLSDRLITIKAQSNFMSIDLPAPGVEVLFGDLEVSTGSGASHT